MEIRDILISGKVEEKIRKKHGVRPSELEEVLWNEDFPPWIRKSSQVPGRYVIYGRTLGGRYLKIAVSLPKHGRVEVRTALDMKDGERRACRKHAKREG